MEAALHQQTRVRQQSSPNRRAPEAARTSGSLSGRPRRDSRYLSERRSSLLPKPYPALPSFSFSALTTASHAASIGHSKMSFQEPRTAWPVHGCSSLYGIGNATNLRPSTLASASILLRNPLVHKLLVRVRCISSTAYWNNEKGELSLCDSIHISIAVATDKGLITPIIRNADQKTLSATSLEVKELAAKARAGKLTPNEFQGGTFSISNLGMFPVDNFCAIINPPQACILAVGRGNKVVEPVVGSDGIEKPGIVTKMSLTLSADHRVFDGRLGGKFLSALASNFSEVRRLLL